MPSSPPLTRTRSRGHKLCVRLMAFMADKPAVVDAELISSSEQCSPIHLSNYLVTIILRSWLERDQIKRSHLGQKTSLASHQPITRVCLSLTEHRSYYWCAERISDYQSLHYPYQIKCYVLTEYQTFNCSQQQKQRQEPVIYSKVSHYSDPFIVIVTPSISN